MLNCIGSISSILGLAVSIFGLWVTLQTRSEVRELKNKNAILKNQKKLLMKNFEYILSDYFVSTKRNPNDEYLSGFNEGVTQFIGTTIKRFNYGVASGDIFENDWSLDS